MTRGTLLGAAASSRFWATNLTLLVPPVQLVVSDELLQRLSGGQVGLDDPAKQAVSVQATSAKRRSRFAGATVDEDATPVTLAPGETALVRQRLYLPRR